MPDVLDEAFRLYRANFPLLAGLSFAVALPSLAISLLSGSYSAVGTALEAVTHPMATFPTFTPPNLAGAILQYPVLIAMLPFQIGALLLATGSIVLGLPVTIPTALRGIVRRYFALLVLGLLYGTVAVTWLCLPLGIWLSVRLALAANVLLVEQAGIGAAIERSWQLTGRAFWRIFVILLLALLLGQVLEFALVPVFLGAAALFPGLPINLRGALLITSTTLVAQLVQPLFAVAVTLIYFDQRVRREALDLEMIAYRISQPSQEPTA